MTIIAATKNKPKPQIGTEEKEARSLWLIVVAAWWSSEVKWEVSIMSWNSYIDTVKAYSRDATGKEHIDKVCIIGLDGVRYTDDTHPSSLKVSIWYAFDREYI